MRIRIKPIDIKVPSDDPFRHDALDRKESVEILARLIRSVDGTGVFGVDADWGNGKTTFIRMLERFLQNGGVPVVSFNAWESDYVSDPFTAIATELTDGLGERASASDAEIKKTFKAGLDCAKAVIKTRWPAVLKALLGQVPVADKALEEVIDGVADAYADERVSAYREAREAVGKFRRALQDMAQAVSADPKQPLLVVTIDELDRCRPSYAVELLEVAKHLFAVDGVVFVVAVNRSELAHSVQALYGPAFDARGYLGRFFDVDFRLPAPDRVHFIRKTIEGVGINIYLSAPFNQGGLTEYSTPEAMLVSFFGETATSLRTVARAIHHLGLVYGALADKKKVMGPTIATLVILRTLDRDLYYRFVDGQASDAEVIDSVMKLLGPNAHTRHESQIVTFSTWLIFCHRERDRPDNYHPGSLEDTPLMKQYSEVALEAVFGDKPEDNMSSKEQIHAERVLQLMEANEKIKLGISGIGFVATVQLIELLSPDLGEEPAKPTK